MKNTQTVQHVDPMPARGFNPRWWGPLCLAVLLSGTGCELRKRMYDQPRYEPLEYSDFFGDARSARPIIEGTVHRGSLKTSTHLYEGKVNGEFVETLPLLVTRETLDRGRDRYNINCAPCHGLAGYGNGMVTQRGFKQPPSYHMDRLRDEKAGYFYDVISKGFGTMPSYAYHLKPMDRWAVVAYIRALQLSQNAPFEFASDEAKMDLMADKP